MGRDLIRTAAGRAMTHKLQAVGFKPAQFGLHPVACRDLILRLRDDSRLRGRLPEFDSVRDLAVSEVMSGELIEPRL